MKKILLFVFFLSTSFLIAQEFETGKISVELSDAGRLRIYAPDFNKMQIDRSSLLFAVSAEAVYAYNEDADSMIAAMNIENPDMSDFELYGIANNAWSDFPPDIENEMHVYGWKDEAYVIAEFKVLNVESSAMNGVLGLEIIPKVDDTYGLETVKIVGDVVAIFRRPSPAYPTSTYTGYKILSPELKTYQVINWYDGYDGSNPDLYNWVTAGTIGGQLNSGSDGAVAFMGTDFHEVAAGDSYSLQFAVAVGGTQDEMLANMTKAVERFNNPTSVKQDGVATPDKFELSQNYPNPFNPSTKIKFSIPEDGIVSLKIYNMLGELQQELISQNMPSGSYEADINMDNLSSGMYIYTLRSGSRSISKKMLLVK